MLSHVVLQLISAAESVITGPPKPHKVAVAATARHDWDDDDITEEDF